MKQTNLLHHLYTKEQQPMNKNFLHSSFFSLLFSLFFFALTSSFSYAQSAADPFLSTPGTRWQGRINYKDAEGVKHSDFYEIIFIANGTCIVSVRTKENGEELFQDGDGLWFLTFSEEFGDTLRIECDFIDPTIERLSEIRWVSFYQFDNPNSFRLLVPPYPDAKNYVRLQLKKTED
jgi:hypothetical protein